MSLKMERSSKRTIIKRIQELQKFLSEREQHDFLKTIAQDLVEDLTVLESGKLSLHIVSPDASAKRLAKYLEQDAALCRHYQIQAIALPDETKMVPVPTAVLKLQSSTQPQQYPFNASEKLLVGRHGDCQAVIPDHYLLVSGQHAEIQYVQCTEGSNSGSWQIRDISRHGTYVNGQQIHHWHDLQTDDRILLGNLQITEISAELVFEEQDNLQWNYFAQVERFYQRLGHCDVLCWVLPANQPLSAQTQKIIEKLAQSQCIRQLFIIEALDVAGVSPIATKRQTNCIKTQLKNCRFHSPVELLSFSLNQTETSAKKQPSLQDSIEQFYQPLSALLSQGGEEVLAKRMTIQVLEQLNQVEYFFSTQMQLLEREIQRSEAKLQKETVGSSSKPVDKILKQIVDGKTEYLKQIKVKLEQSKDDLLYEPLTHSIMYKIRQATDRLVPHIPDKHLKYLELGLEVAEPKKLKSSRSRAKKANKPMIDANTFLLETCHQELQQWAANEWQNIWFSYADGGLNGFFQKMHHAVPAITTANNLNPSPSQETIDIQAVFQDSFDRPTCRTAYSDVSLPGYLLKKIRGSMMQIMSGMILLSFVGISRRQTVQWVIAYITASPVLTAVIVVFMVYLLKLLFDSYREDIQTARNQEADKLKDKLRSHYQHITKTRFIPKLMQKLNQSLEAEFERIDSLIETIKQPKSTTSSDSEKQQALLKTQIVNRKEQQKVLERQMRDLQKLKRV
jgi:hypothetical protein